MKPIYYSCFILAVVFVLSGAPVAQAKMDVPLMTKDELKSLLGQPNVIVLDVRRGKDWTSSEFKIQGAIYENPGNFDQWASKYPKDKKLVLYCA